MDIRSPLARRRVPNQPSSSDLLLIIRFIKLFELDRIIKPNPMKIKNKETILLISSKLEINKLILVKNTQHVTNNHHGREIRSIGQSVFNKIAFNKIFTEKHDDNQQ